MGEFTNQLYQAATHSYKSNNFVLLISIIFSMVKKVLWACIIALLTVNQLNANKTVFKLRVKIHGATDTAIFLAHYHGEKQYVDDTARQEKSGWYTFTADSIPPGGLYIIAGQKKNRIFEFLMNGETSISFETQQDNAASNMVVKGSPENEAFYKYVTFINKKQKEIEPLQKAFKRLDKTSDSLELVKKQITAINDEVQAFIKASIENNQGTFMAAFIKASQDPVIPESPKLANGKPDSLFPYRYYKAHFFDNLDIGDARLLRTPLYHQRLDQYFTKMILQSPDTVIKETNLLLPMVSKSGDTYRYFIWYLTNYTERSEIMGMDKAFVYLVDNFYTNGKMDFWINKTVKENLSKKAKKLTNVLIDAIAPELIMLDTLMQPVSLHGVKAKLTLLFFWDPTCGHCKKEVPKLVDFYNKEHEKIDLKVFAVCSDTNMAEMKKYIRKSKMNFINVNGPRTYTPNYHDLYDIYSTPVFYLLDENKRILAKRLMTDQLVTFIERYLKNEKQGQYGIKEE